MTDQSSHFISLPNSETSAANTHSEQDPVDSVAASPTRCHAHNRRGEQCGRFACKGQQVCDRHGGATRHAKRAAAKRAVLASAVAIVQAEPPSPGEDLDIDAETRRTIGQLVRLRDALESKTAELQSITVTDVLGKEDLSATLAAYKDTLKACADILIKAKRAGVAESDAVVEAELGRRVSAVFIDALSDPDASLTDNQALALRIAFARIWRQRFGGDQ